MKVVFFFQICNYSINIPTFLMNQCSKFGQKTSQFPCHGSSQVDLGEIFQPCFFNVFFSVLYFFLQTASKQQLLWYILFCALPYKSWLYKDANHIRKNKINLALRIAVLSVNGTIQDGIGGNWASPRSTGKAQWHRLAGRPQWGTKGTTQSCR